MFYSSKRKLIIKIWFDNIELLRRLKEECMTNNELKDKSYIIDNLTEPVKELNSKENGVTIIYMRTVLKEYKIFISRLVGVVTIKCRVDKFKQIDVGEILFNIKFLNINYEVQMEDKGMIEKIYVKSGDIIMFGSPLVLIKCKKKHYLKS